MGEEKLPFYEKKSSFIIMKLSYILGAVLIIASPFFKWEKLIIKSDKYTKGGFSLFDCAKEGIKSMRSGFKFFHLTPIVIMALIMLIGLYMLYVALVETGILNPGEYSEFFLDKRLKKNYFISRLIAIPIELLLMLAAVNTKIYKYKYNEIKNIYDVWMEGINSFQDKKGYKSLDYVKLYHPLGFYAIFVGLALFLFAAALKFLLETLNEDD